MTPDTPGLHHVTAIAGDPSGNAGFYVDTLGLRFVKRTVNHDDTGTYHFYFGDGEGTPGTNITFFPWTGSGRPGKFGPGQTRDTAYLIRPESVDYWVDRLDSRGIDVERSRRFDEPVLRFDDPDGIGIELVGSEVASSAERSSADRSSGARRERSEGLDEASGEAVSGPREGDASGRGNANGRETPVSSEAATDADATPWNDGPVPTEHQLRGFHSVTLGVREVEPTAGVLTGVLGYEREETIDDGGGEAGSDGRRHRYRSAAGGPGSIVDLVEVGGSGRMGIGAVHHVAFKTSDTDEQERFREAFQEHGQRVTEIIDRTYFRSIYSREPGGVLFEVATTGPGFAVDEDPSELGTRLTLPEWLEDERAEIEAQLPPFELPDAMGGETVEY